MPRVRYQLDPARSQVWIDGSSSIHPIRATATGLEGWVELLRTKTGIAAAPAVSGEVRIAVERLRSGNPIVDAETRRRIDASRYPEITGTVTTSQRVATDRLALSGAITFRGETQPVDGELEATLRDGELHLSGEQQFDVRTWKLQPPRVGLLRVHPTIAVRLQAVAVPGGGPTST